MKYKVKTIYERVYDNPLSKDGSIKPNKCLGDFEIIEKIIEDTYNSTMIGKRLEDGELYLILEREINGFNGGSKFEIIQIYNLKVTNEK